MKTKQKIIGLKEIKNAYKTLLLYKEGKRFLEERIVENEEWYKLRCCPNVGGVEKSQNSAWLFNSIINKHADAMDSFPEPNILAREEGDEEQAKLFSAILPVILEQRGFEQTYSDAWWYKLKTGTGVYGVFWNNELENGLGDVDIKQLDILNLFWEPGIKYLEQSANLFYATAVDRQELISRYPEKEEQIKKGFGELSAYRLEDGITDDSKALVVDWYYKKKVGNKTLLHYCKFSGEALLFASENEAQYQNRGFYDHGKYPIVFDTLFVTENSPAGFGYVDAMKECQISIDKLNTAIERNALMGEMPRFFISDSAGINEEEFADWSRPFIHTTGRIDDQTLKQVEVGNVSSNALELLTFKVNELKETSGNRDFSQGSTNYGVTAASAILALQEAGNKLSRDMIKSAFRAYANICYLILELVRQFYTEPRSFRITGDDGNVNYITYQSNDALGRKIFANSRPVFDIKIVPQKQNPYQKAQQNELAKELFSLGMLAPERREEARLAIKLMDFYGKEELLNKLSVDFAKGDAV
ncbi:MAG: hypothetical protein E7551_00815 [Ruminococcaceae bacterium]|nr:hypothetical protein [Oscillospiraceae bacterium]